MFNKKKIQQLERQNEELKSTIKDLGKRLHKSRKEYEIKLWKHFNPPKYEKGDKVDVLLITEVKFVPKDLLKAVLSSSKLKFDFFSPLPIIPSISNIKEINKSPYAHHHWKYEIVDTENGRKIWVTEDELKEGNSIKNWDLNI